MNRYQSGGAAKTVAVFSRRQPVVLGLQTSKTPSFVVPVGPATLTFRLKVKDICAQLKHHKPDNYKDTDSVTITVEEP